MKLTIVELVPLSVYFLGRAQEFGRVAFETTAENDRLIFDCRLSRSCDIISGWILLILKIFLQYISFGM